MKRESYVIWGLIAGFVVAYSIFPSHAQKLPKNFTLVYSNNMNGEIDPCPT